MEDEKELQEKILTFRILESRLNGLLRKRELVAAQINEIQNVLGGIEDLEKNLKEEILFPIGNGVSVFGKVVNEKKLIVQIGANVALEKSPEDAKKILEKRKTELESIMKTLERDIENISKTLQEMAPQIQEMQGG